MRIAPKIAFGVIHFERFRFKTKSGSALGKRESNGQRCACETIISCFAASGVARTIGPPMKTGGEFHFASLEKTATTSQRILLREHDAACDSER
jgi:hypothetical protein